jgi:hypothetical protein
MARATRPRRPSGLRKTPHWLVLHVSIDEIDPPIWRRIGVPDRLSLHQLHRVFQLAFGWLDYHLYEFRIGPRSFQEPLEEAEGEDATGVALAGLALAPGDRFTYAYDFGDDWVHTVRVEAVTPLEGEAGTVLPRLIDGARAGPPEDAGGPWGYQECLEALGSPEHEEHETIRTWVGPGYDPERFDQWMVDHALQLAAGWGAL